MHIIAVPSQPQYAVVYAWRPAKQVQVGDTLKKNAYRDVAEKHEGFVQGSFQFFLGPALASCPQLHIHILGYQLSRPAQTYSEGLGYARRGVKSGLSKGGIVSRGR